MVFLRYQQCMPRHGHAKADERSLELHQAALEKLGKNPELRPPVVKLVERWLEREDQRSSRPWLEEWRDMLTTWTLPAIMDLVLDEERGHVLRQCSPLAPVLTPRERWAVLKRVTSASKRG